jgi:hypothetical protein
MPVGLLSGVSYAIKGEPRFPKATLELLRSKDRGVESVGNAAEACVYYQLGNPKSNQEAMALLAHAAHVDLEAKPKRVSKKAAKAQARKDKAERARKGREQKRARKK